jgi:hypothetical protein
MAGIPSSLRPQVWPLAIGNALEITPELFESFIKLARLNQKSFGENKATGFLGQEKSIAQLQHDLPLTYPGIDCSYSPISIQWACQCGCGRLM